MAETGSAFPFTPGETRLRVCRQLRAGDARTFLCFPFAVLPGTGSLTIQFEFSPPTAHRYRNLLTLTLFDPTGFRGAGHRHAPEQVVVIEHDRATPGFLAGPVPAGEWLLEVDCHCVLETEGVGVTFSVEVYAEAATAEGARNSRELRDARDAEAAAFSDATTGAPAGWLKGDLHVHTTHSDGRWSASELIRYVKECRLDFLAVTDHNTIAGREDMERAFREAGLSTLLIPAMELTTFFGHANALGLTDWIDWRVRGPEGWPLTIGEHDGAPPSRVMGEAAAEVRRLGGTFVINHPRSGGYPGCTGCRWEFGDESAGYADVIEIWNGVWDRDKNGAALDLWTRWLNAGRQIRATAGSDSHLYPKRPSRLGFTFVHAARTSASILSAVRRGDSYLSCGPMLRWCRSGDLPRQPASSASSDVACALKISRPEDGQHTASLGWGDLANWAELRVVQNGHVVERWPVHQDGQRELAVRTQPGGWLRAELYLGTSENLLAITNPLFFD